MASMSWYGAKTEAGMWPAVYERPPREGGPGTVADRPRLQLVAAVAQLGHGDPLDPLHGPALFAPARHPAREDPCDLGDADRRGEVDRVLSVRVVAADEHDRLAGTGEPGELRAEPGAQRGDGHRVGDVRVVELQVGANVHEQRAVAVGLLDLARRERADLRNR